MSSQFDLPYHLLASNAEYGEGKSEESEKSYIKQYKWSTQPNQTYAGSFMYDNLHGSGTYFIDNGHKIFYDGLYYVNKLEGYCQIFYSENGTHFQGLFKDNRRFGPGVLTYADGRQDVGLWDGFSLIRVGKVHFCFLNMLASTNVGNIKMLKFRKLVDVNPEDRADVPKQLLKELGSGETLLSKSLELYNTNVKNRNNTFFPKEVYDRYYPEKACMIEILVDDSISNMSEPQGKTAEDELEVKLILEKLEVFNNRLEDLRQKLQEIGIQRRILEKKIHYCNKCCNTDEEQSTAHVNEIPVVTADSKNKFTHSLSPAESSKTVKIEISLASLGLGDMSYSSSTTQTAEETTKSRNTETEVLISNRSFCMDEMEIDDIAALENELEILIKEDIFYTQIFEQLTEKQKKLLNQLEIRQTVKSTKIVVDTVLAWNNEPAIMKMLKHSFYYRKTEYMVNFQVLNILAGRREGFGPPGDLENDCTTFFNHCCVGENVSIIGFLKRPDFNVNVTDAIGNSGIFFATSNNRFELIRVLAEFGANTNQLNDESLTPLSLAVICYLTEKYHIENFEDAFIPEIIISEEEAKEVKTWYPSRSFLDVAEKRRSSVHFSSATTKTRKISKKSNSESNMKKEALSSFIFSTRYPEYKLKNSNENSSSSKTDSNYLPDTLRDIEQTIETLLEYGARPYYGDSPIPVFLMTLYTENSEMVQLFLEYGANVDVVTPFEELNGLHIMASAKCIEENLRICRLLIKYKCNPNFKARRTHWRDQREKLLAFKDINDFDDDAKNTLHTLCLRTDFSSDNCNYFESLATMLVKGGVDVNATYLGQDALRLAILSNNLNLVRHLLELDIIDPYRTDPDEGNVLTMFFNNRFITFLTLQEIKKIIETLTDKNVNPLNVLNEYENVADFVKTKAKVKNQKKKKRKQKGKEKEKSGKTVTLNDKNRIKLIQAHNKLLKKLEKFMNTLTRKIILQKVGMVFTKALYIFAEAGLLGNELIKPIALYVNPQSFLTNLKLLYNHGKIEQDKFDVRLVQKAIDFLVENCKFPKPKRQKSPKPENVNEEKETGSTADTLGAKSSHDFLQFIENMHFQKMVIAKKKYDLFPPGLDDPERYKVCFQCLKKVEEYLCRICQKIYFCSKKCYLKNLKSKTERHPCEVNMFEDREQEVAGVMDLFHNANELSEKRYLQKKNEELEMEKERLAKARKQDIYGIKSLKTLTISTPTPAGTDFQIRTGLQTRTEVKIGGMTSVVNKDMFTKMLSEKLNTYRTVVQERKIKLQQSKSSPLNTERAVMAKPGRKIRHRGGDDDFDATAQGGRDKRKTRGKAKGGDNADGDYKDKVRRGERKTRSRGKRSDDDDDDYDKNNDNSGRGKRKAGGKRGSGDRGASGSRGRSKYGSKRTDTADVKRLGRGKKEGGVKRGYEDKSGYAEKSGYRNESEYRNKNGNREKSGNREKNGNREKSGSRVRKDSKNGRGRYDVTCKPPCNKKIESKGLSPGSHHSDDGLTQTSEIWRNAPIKPIFFLEILTKLFPDVDLTKLMIPFTCYLDGHLYYQFNHSEFFCPNYSIQ